MSHLFKREVLRDGKRETEYACSPNVGELGINWVRDLALQCKLTTHKPQGEVVLELIGGGVAFNCILNIEKGTATLRIPGQSDFKPVTVDTPVKGTGSWRILFANIDDQLRLFVNSDEIEFPEHNGIYSLSDDRSPTVRDLTPAAIGALNAEVSVEHLTVWRDIYYIAHGKRVNAVSNADYEGGVPDSVNGLISLGIELNEESLRRSFSDPSRWQNLGKTHVLTRTLGKGQFFAMGDNTAHSKDSRSWMDTPDITYYVPEKFLVGKALFVHWPHGKPIPGTNLNFVPNVKKMRFID